MFTEKDFWDYFSEETIIIDLISTQKPANPKLLQMRQRLPVSIPPKN